MLESVPKSHKMSPFLMKQVSYGTLWPRPRLSKASGRLTYCSCDASSLGCVKPEACVEIASSRSLKSVSGRPWTAEAPGIPAVHHVVLGVEGVAELGVAHAIALRARLDHELHHVLQAAGFLGLGLLALSTKGTS